MTKKHRLFWPIVLLALFEGVSFLWWLFFGSQRSPFDWQYPIGFFFTIWGVMEIAEAFERREDRRNARLRDIETRLEALYKWGNLYSVDEEKDLIDPEQEKDDLDEETRTKIDEYSKSIESGEYDYSYHLGVIYWNVAMKHYNPRTMEGYRKSIYWLRKSSKVGFDCWSTLAEAYQELKEYDKAMLWYRRVAKRGDKLAHYAEASIADMYADGQGVLQNYAEAARWWLMAAQHGSRFANYDLGKLYAKGAEGVALDYCKAYFHLFIASSDNDLSGIIQQVVERRDEVAKHLSESEIAKEQERANEWLLCHRKTSKVDRLPLPV